MKTGSHSVLSPWMFVRPVGLAALLFVGWSTGATAPRAIGQEPTAREVQESQHDGEDAVADLERQALSLEEDAKYEAALEIRRRILALQTRRLEKGHPQLVDAQLLVDQLQRITELTPDQLERFNQSTAAAKSAMEFAQRGQLQAAENLLRQSLSLHEQAVGKRYLSYLDLLRAIGLICADQGKYQAAAKYLRTAAEIQRHIQGEDHPEYQYTLLQLAEILHANAFEHLQQDELARAGTLLDEALAIRQALFGEQHWRTVDARLDRKYVDRLLQLSPAQRAQLERSYEQADKSLNLAKQGHSEEAIQLGEEICDIRKQLLESDYREYAQALNDLAMRHKQAHNLERSAEYYRRALQVFEATVGKSHPDYAVCLDNYGLLLQELGKYGQAEQMHRSAIEIFAATNGEESPSYATAINNLTESLRAVGSFDQAEPLLRETVRVIKEYVGPESPDYAIALDNLATFYQDIGELAEAEPLMWEAAELFRQHSQGTIEYVKVLNNLAVLYLAKGQYARSFTLIQQALQVCRDTLGENHIQYAGCLQNLSRLYDAMGDEARAIQALQQALEIREQNEGRDSPHYAVGLRQLAAKLSRAGKVDLAEESLLQARALEERTVGKRSPEYAATLRALGMLQMSRGRLEEAEPLLRDSLQIVGEAFSQDHPDYAVSLADMALLEQGMGRMEDAEQHLRQSLQINKQALGERHPDYAQDLVQLALLTIAGGRYSEAGDLLEQSMDISLDNLRLSSSVQSERQQLAMARDLRSALDIYVALALDTGRPAGKTYENVLAWKGLVFARQRRMRLARREPELAETFVQLQSAASRLATFALSAPSEAQRENWRRQISALTDEKERLEQELSAKSVAFRRQHETERTSVEHLQHSLPPGTALVDIFEISRPSFGNGDATAPIARHLVAYVVRREGQIIAVELGPSEPIHEAVELWRLQLRQEAGVRGLEAIEPPAITRTDPGTQLRQLIWDPLVEHLDGVHTVLVSPDGDLNRLSLAALPGKRPDSYLVEETAIAVIPVPQFLPELMRETAATEEEQPASMLLVGNVAYDLESSALRPSSTAIAAEPERTRSILPYSPRSAVIHGKRVHFPSLQGAAKEVASIQALHADNFPQDTRTVLSGNEATKSNVRNAVAGNRYIHMATHGFFASAGQSAGWQSTLQGQTSHSNKSAVSQLTMMLRSQQPVSVHPGVLSGLALAGANEERPAKNTNPTTFFDDGILTAVEVAELDLGETDLVVLSACDTGLGAVAGGEGVLGLQRAFQVAGTRSVVTSLWGVDDQATRALMERFYENLWKKKMDKLGALREAQLWMLSGRLSGDGARSESPSAEEIRVKPYYWAAFVLSGDWR